MILNKIKGVLIKYHLGLAMAFIFLFSSCSTKSIDLTGNQHLQQALKDKAFSGEEFFQAVYFLDGPVASVLGDYQELSINNLSDDKVAIKKAKEFQRKIIDFIKSNDSNFFSDFKSKITSGNYSVVHKTIYNGVDVYMNALTSITGKKIDKAKTQNLIRSFNAKYGYNKPMSKSQLAKNMKGFSKSLKMEMVSDKASLDNQLQSSENNTQPDTKEDNESIKDPGVELADNTVYYQNYFWVYIAAAAAVAVILFLFLLAEPSPEKPPLEKVLLEEESFVSEDYVATITEGMSGL